MPDRELTDEEIKEFTEKRLSTAIFHALKPFDAEGARPTFYDFLFKELQAQIALAEFRVIEHYKKMEEMRDYLGAFLDVGKSLFELSVVKGKLDQAKQKRRRK